MRFREWFRDALQPLEAGDPASPPPGELEHLREVSQELLSAGQDAINKALSGNSQAFLAATKQQGGQ
jgi:hypothetical protein